jgi:hypothetical protein
LGHAEPHWADPKKSKPEPTQKKKAQTGERRTAALRAKHKGTRQTDQGHGVEAVALGVR